MNNIPKLKFKYLTLEETIIKKNKRTWRRVYK